MFWSKQAYLGPYLGRKSEGGKLLGTIHHPGPKHLLSLGPPRSGKSMALAATNLQCQRRSMFVIDVRGDLAAISARHRAKMGRVIILNPFGMLLEKLPHLKSHGWNPSATLDPKSDSFVSEADAIGEAQVPIDNDSQPFFPNAGRNMVASFTMMDRLTNGPRANIVNVRTAMTAITSYGRDKRPNGGFLKSVLDMATCNYAPIANRMGPIAERLADDNASTGSIRDVLSSAVEGTKFIDSPPIMRDLQGPGIDFAAMRREIVTVYVILPPNELSSQSKWIRMLINSALRSLYADMDKEPSKLPPPLFILDEFFAIGKLDMIEVALATGGGNGVVIWPMLQDLCQLDSLYSKTWRSFLSCAGAITAFAPKEWFTATELAQLGGERTGIIASTNVDHEGRISTNYTAQGFPLLRPEDLMRMPPRHMVCFVEPSPYPFFTYAPPYPLSPYGKGLDANPYYRK